MKSDWLIGVTVFLPFVALLFPVWYAAAIAIGLACGIAWMLRNWGEL